MKSHARAPNILNLNFFPSAFVFHYPSLPFVLKALLYAGCEGPRKKP